MPLPVIPIIAASSIASLLSKRSQASQMQEYQDEVAKANKLQAEKDRKAAKRAAIMNALGAPQVGIASPVKAPDAPDLTQEQTISGIADTITQLASLSGGKK